MTARIAALLAACSLVALLVVTPVPTVANQTTQDPPKKEKKSKKDKKLSDADAFDSKAFDDLMNSLEAMGGKIEALAKQMASKSAKLAEECMSMTAEELSNLADTLNSYPRYFYQDSDGIHFVQREPMVRDEDEQEMTTVQSNSTTTTICNNGHSSSETTVRVVRPDTTIVHHLRQNETLTVNDSAEVRKIIIIRDGDTIRKETITPRMCKKHRKRNVQVQVGGVSL
jgi:hypothetical protein